MIHVTRLLLFALVGAQTLVISPLRADTGPTETIVNKIEESVVQILAENCTDASRTGSGFIWSSMSDVVTDLHVINGCKKLTVHLAGGADVPATLIRTLIPADLALLRIPKQTSIQPLQISTHKPQFNDMLQAIGYYFGVATMDTRPLRVTNGTPILQDMLTADLQQAISAVGSPSLTINIVRLDGNLVPGLSGAPLIDSSGGVVGIGSGGLDNGAVGISWAIQARYLNDLQTAALVTSTNSNSSDGLFAAPLAGSIGNSIQCGQLTFFNVKTRTLSQLLATADDVPGFFAIAATTGMNQNQLNVFSYDVYSEQNSGGSVALPHGAQLTSTGHGCISTLGNGLSLELSSAVVQSVGDIQNASVAFESGFDPHGLFWQPDLNFSYSAPMTRPDGLTIRRKNFDGFLPPPSGMLHGDTFETLMAKKGSFIGIRVLNTNYLPLLYQQCKIQPQYFGCNQVNDLFQTWVAAALGIQLSTFPRT